MNKFTKKILVVFMMFPFILTLFSGCSNENNTAGDSTPEAKVELNQNEQKENEVVIKWYTDSDDTTNKQYRFDEVVQAFEQQNPGIKIELKSLVANTSMTEYKKKVDIMIASGEQIDVMNFSPSTYLGMKAQAGVLEPLDIYAEKEGIKLEDEYTGIQRIDGHVYSIPSQYAPWLVFINKDMLEEAGLPLPPKDWTWDDYREYAKKMTKGEGASKVYGSYFHTWEWYNAVGYQSAIMDNPFYKKDGSANFDHPIFAQFMKYRYDLENIDKTQIPFVDVKTQKMSYRSLFFNGKVAMMPMGAWMLSDIKNQEKYPHEFETTFATWPMVDKSSVPNTTTDTASGCGYNINAKSKNKEAAYKFIRFLTTKGFDMSKSLLSPWKNADHDAIVKEIMGADESLYDMESFRNVVLDPDFNENVWTTHKEYDLEVIGIFNEECEKYFVGGLELEQAIENMQRRTNEVINRNN